MQENAGKDRVVPYLKKTPRQVPRFAAVAYLAVAVHTRRVEQPAFVAAARFESLQPLLAVDAVQPLDRHVAVKPLAEALVVQSGA